MSTEQPTAKTAQHYEAGAKVFHKEHGIGTIMVREDGAKYPRFAKGTGTRYTRVYPA